MPAPTSSSPRAAPGIRIPPVRFGVQAYRIALAAGAAAGIILVHGFQTPPLSLTLITVLQMALVAAYWTDVIIRHFRNSGPIPGEKLDAFDAAMAALLVLGIILHLFFPQRNAWIVAEVAMLWTLLAELWRLYVALSRRMKRPGILMPLSFVLLILVGTVLLKTPVAVGAGMQGERLSWLDAAFTMTSAVCVTGLVVRDTAHDFSPLGQAIIGVFIQLGGLGIIVFGSTLALMVGHRISPRGARELSQLLQDEPVDRLRRFTRFIIVATIAIELVGAALMYPLWHPAAAGAHAETLTPVRRVGLSLFHSVSAFCNAGFDITGASLVPYRNSALTYFVIAPLIVLGGIGFPVLNNVLGVAHARLHAIQWRALWQRVTLRTSPFHPTRLVIPNARAAPRLTLHTRIVLVTTAALILWGILTIGAAQALSRRGLPAEAAPTTRPELVIATPRDRGVAGSLADAAFMSISARTAGFNSLPMDHLEPASRFSLITLMLIGGSPGGAAGGLKTTVFAVLLWSAISTMRQRRETEAFGRTVADALVRQAGTIAFCYVLLVVVSTLLLSLSEDASFGVVFFEVVSAATTTGLSLGLTPELTTFGKIVIMSTMFLGRIGPLALFAALILRRTSERPYAYPHESVALG